MAPIKNNTVVREIRSSFSPAARAFALVGLILWWFGVIIRFSRMWNSQLDYNYGWLVPFLSAVLFAARWNRRPTANHSNDRAPLVIPFVLLVVMAASLLVLLLPVLEANPTWPTVLWATALAAVALTAGFMGAIGGANWFRHFFPPTSFMLLALPWPAMVMGPLMQILRETNAIVAAEVVTAFGHPAVAHGTVVQVATGMVGIDEACSGLRSLQSVLMASLFFGEFYRFSGRRRLSLILGAVFLAISINLCRTIFLTWQAAVVGTEVMIRWHDLAGYLELGISMVALWLLTLSLRGQPFDSKDETSVSEVDMTRIPKALGIFVFSSYLVAEAGTQIWYRAHESYQSGKTLSWAVKPRQSVVHPVVISSSIREILRCDDAVGMAWDGDLIHRWLSYTFQWNGGVATRGLPEIHSPEVCLPAAGARLTANLGTILVPVGSTTLQYRFYRFHDNGRDYHVFFCLWDRRDGKPLLGQGSTSADITRYRLNYVREGRRVIDMIQSEIVLFGARDDVEAETLFREMMSGALTVLPGGN